MIRQLWYILRSVPTIQHCNMRAIRLAICVEEAIPIRMSTRTRGETREGGGEGKKERWKVKVCHDCESRFVVCGIEVSFGHLRLSKENDGTKELLPLQKVELKIVYPRVERKRGREYAFDLASQI